MRILVAFEDEYRGLRELIAFAFRGARPGDEVEAVPLGALREGVARFDPHLVISSVPNAGDPVRTVAWVQLSPDPDFPSGVCVGGRRWEAPNPSLKSLLSFAEEAEGLVRNEGRSRAC